jgi:hypothetical protein
MQPRAGDDVATAIGTDQMCAAGRKIGQHLGIDGPAADDDKQAIERDRLLHRQISRSRCVASRWGGPDDRT